MRAVKGEVVSSNPISLLKAAAVLSRFSASETGARPDVAAYLKRAAAAFNELAVVHREIRAHRGIFHVEEKKGVTQDEDDSRWMKKKNKKKKRKHLDSEQGEVSSERVRKEVKRKKKKRTIE